MVLSAITMAVGSVQAARLLHQTLLHNKMRSPQSFFDTTPLGRILNRFSKDIYVIDEVLSPTILTMLGSFYNSISTLVVVVVSTPLFAVVILPLAALYICVQVCSKQAGMAVGGRARCCVGGAFDRCGQVSREVRPQGGSWIWLGAAVSYFPSLKLIFLTCKIES